MENQTERDNIINKINHVLNQPWTNKTRTSGKTVEVPKEWDQLTMHNIILEYRKIGWKVYWIETRNVEYLEFEFPTKKS